MLFAYQAYVLINKNIVSQKYLKSVVIGRTLNRYEIVSEQGGITPPTDGRYFYRFAESNAVKDMTYDLDKSTAELLTAFVTEQTTKKALVGRLTAGKQGYEALGVCLGGGSLMNDQTSYDVFDLSNGDTCGKK